MTTAIIGKSFYDAINQLDPADQARVNKFVPRFMENPENPGTSLERVRQAKDGKIWSARISRGIRAILHKDGGRSFLLYVGQHDDAYDWAARRRVETHPVTGAVQIVETVESVEEALASHPHEPEIPALFPEDRYESEYLLSLGLPSDWLPTLRRIATEDDLLVVAERLPEEVSERLLTLYDGELVTPPKPTPIDAPIERNPDSLRRFFVVQDEADLADVLNQPLQAWIRFLHPSQRALVEGSFSGPAKITGSAGTGKTVVALHRARELARQGKHVLLTSFVKQLCRNLERQIGILCRPEVAARIQIATVHQQAFQLARTVDPKIRAVGENEIRKLLVQNRKRARIDAEDGFLWSEWTQVIDRQGLVSWEAYRGADRRGRGRPLTVRDREKLWQVFGNVWSDLEAKHRTTWEGLCRLAADQLAQGRIPSPFDSVIVDEVQDLQPAAIQLLAALGGKGRDGLMLAGDAGQRIYPGGFSLRSLGIDVRGRSRVLRINYRTTAQIQRAADRLIGTTADDLDEGSESRRGTLSLLRGPEPTLRGFGSPAEEQSFLTETIRSQVASGLALDEIAVFARTRKLCEQIRDGLRASGLASQLFGDGDAGVGAAESDEPTETGVHVSTMHGAKGLEFKAVFVAACDERRMPNAYVLDQIEDPVEREAALAQERSLLYVSLTRARDEVFVSWSGKPSPFLSEIQTAPSSGKGGRA